jgi:beta-glucosidase
MDAEWRSEPVTKERFGRLPREERMISRFWEWTTRHRCWRRGLAAAGLAGVMALAGGGVAAASNTAADINPCATGTYENGPDNQLTALGSSVSLQLQVTTLPPGGLLRFSAEGLPPGLSIDSYTGLITGTPTTVGLYTAAIELSSCQPLGGFAFRWRVTSPGPILGLDGLCVDVAGANTANFTPVQIYTCNGTAAQQWTVSGDPVFGDGVDVFTLHALGKCLDVYGGGTANGTQVDLYDCNSTDAQRFTQLPDGSLWNTASRKCLDDPGWSTTPGTQLQVWDCNNTTAQHWTLP